jgi:hypothetical protein
VSLRRGGLALAALWGAIAGCSRADDAAATRAGNESDERTVFNDSSLFRELCLEADSGLTVAAGRCTPRHQGNPIQ